MDNKYTDLSTERLVQMLDEIIVDALNSTEDGVYTQYKSQAVPLLQEINVRNARKAEEAGQKPTNLTWDIRLKIVNAKRT